MKLPNGTVSGEVNPSEIPQLSVIVASAHSARDVEMFLDSLSSQVSGRKVEIIVVDSSQDDDLETVIAKHPEAIFQRFAATASLPELWAFGIGRSKGEIVAIMDSTCPPDERWVDAVVEAHRSPQPVIGGAVELDGRPSVIDLAAYFCEYAQFMRPLAEGAATELPGNNLSVKRWVLAKGQEYVKDRFWKTQWCRKLQDDGVVLISAPSIVVRYRRSFRLLPFTVRRFHHGRCFAGMRVARASTLIRGLYAIGSTMLPAVFTFRVIRTVASKRRYLGKFLLSFPISLAAIVSWSIGELFGYLGGPGGSCAHVR